MALSFGAYRNLLRRDVNSAIALSQAAAREDVALGHRTYLAFQKAELLAHSGQRTSALDALSEDDSELERLATSTEQPAGNGYWYTPPVLLGHRGFVLEALGERTAARAAAAEALAAMPAEWATAEWAADHRRIAQGSSWQRDCIADDGTLRTHPALAHTCQIRELADH